MAKGPKKTTGTQERPTLKTIAYMTGLGVTTVSRALSDAHDISDDTKARVRAVAQEIGYRPNRAGVRLRTGKTNVISFVLSVEREVMGATSQLVYGLTRVLSNTPYHLIVTPYDLMDDPLEAVRYVVETGSADGVVLSRTEPDDPRVRYLQEHNFPFVTHGRTLVETPHAYVDFDNHSYGRMAAEMLIAKGRTRLALLPPPSRLSYATYMTDGFRLALDQQDLQEVPVRGVCVDDSHDDIRNEIMRLMRSRHRPDGLVCASAGSAIAAVAGIEAAGLKLGRDVDLAVKEGFDLMNHFRPELHVICEDFMEAGGSLADAILRLIAGTNPEELQILHAPKV